MFLGEILMKVLWVFQPEKKQQLYLVLIVFLFVSILILIIVLLDEAGAVAQSVERRTPGEEVLGSILSVAARSLLVVSVSV